MGQCPPMFLLFDEAGKFMAGRVLSEAESSAQVELDSGKRVKVKSANMLIKFEKPSPAEFMAAAQAASQDIELEMAWEFAPDEEFGFADLARDYFSAQAPLSEQAAAVSAVRVAALLPPRRQGALSQGIRRCDRPGAGRHREEEAGGLADRRVGRLSWVPGSARSRCASSSTRFCSSPTRTRPSTRPWSRPAAPPTPRRWTCCKRRAPSIRPTSSTGSASCSTFPQGHGLSRAIGDLPLAAVHRPSPSTTRRPPRSTTPYRCRAWARHRHAGHPHRGAGPGHPARRRDLDKLGRTRLSTVYMPGYKITMLPDARGADLHAGRRARQPGACRCT
jgi:exoribonuclease-2